MKKIWETKTKICYQCEKCGLRQIVYKQHQNKIKYTYNNINGSIETEPLCLAIDCEDYGYRSVCSDKVVQLRNKYIGTRINNVDTLMIIEFIDEQRVVLLDIAGYYVTMIHISQLEGIETNSKEIKLR